MADRQKADKPKVEEKRQGDVTVYSVGGVDLLSHKKGDQHYKCLCDVPAQGLHAGRCYDLSPPDFDASLSHALANLAANVS